MAVTNTRILILIYAILHYGCGKSPKQKAIDIVLDDVYANMPYNTIVNGYWHDIIIIDSGEGSGIKMCYRYCYYDISTGDTLERYDKLYLFDLEGVLRYSRDF